MGLGLNLRGAVRDGSLAEGWLARAQEWLHESWAHTLIASELIDDSAGRLCLSFQLYPSASDVRLVAMDRHRIGLAGETLAVGPGYHAHLCELAETLTEELAVEWEPDADCDPSGFLLRGDQAALEAAACAELHQAVRHELRRIEEHGWDGARLNLDDSRWFEVGEAVATPLGPRGLDWLERARNESDWVRDIVPWWEPGVGAEYRLRRALVEMWTNVRWRRPLRDEESGLIRSVLGLLQTAYESNPRLEYPHKEWDELRHYARHPGGPSDDAAVAMGDIGYRRKHVRVRLADDWSVRLPGSFAERWEDPLTYSAWDGARTLWMNCRRLNVDPMPNPLSAGTPIEHVVVPPLQCRAVSYDVDEPERARKVEAQVTMDDHVVLCTIVLDGIEDEPWAIETLRSLRREAPRE